MRNSLYGLYGLYGKVRARLPRRTSIALAEAEWGRAKAAKANEFRHTRTRCSVDRRVEGTVAYQQEWQEVEAGGLIPTKKQVEAVCKAGGIQFLKIGYL